MTFYIYKVSNSHVGAIVSDFASRICMSSFTILAAPSTCHARACSDICCKRGGLINNAATTSSRLCISLAQRAQPRSSNNSAFASSWPE